MSSKEKYRSNFEVKTMKIGDALIWAMTMVLVLTNLGYAEASNSLMRKQIF